MAEPIDPRRPEPPAIPPLQRLWKATPEPEDDPPAVPEKTRKKKKRAGDAGDAKSGGKKSKKKATGPVDDDGTGATKLAETPVLDTYEARQRARWIIGGVLGAVGMISLVVIVRAFRGGEVEPKENGESRETKGALDPRLNLEPEAHNLVEMARQADKAGKPRSALDLLGKVAKNYQGTPSARVAMEAIDRNRRNRPLFGLDADEHPIGPRPPTPTKPGATATTSPAAKAAPEIATATTAAPPAEATGPSPPTPDLVNGRPSLVGKPLPVGFLPKPGAAVHASGWPTEIVCHRDGAIMVLVPGASFPMGRDDGDPAERPAHRVTVSTYYIDQHEVTVRQYQQFLKESGRPLDSNSNRAASKEAPEAANFSDLPAVNVSAREAKAYCEWARRRLPTEAQWELAARSADGRISFWNGDLPRKDPPKGFRTMEPVMSLATDVSPFGAFDLGANAWEWTSEWYDSQHYQQLKAGVNDPTGPAQSRTKPAQVTVKGGSKLGILTWREGVRIEARQPHLGFRGALPVEGTPAAPPSASPANGPALPGGVVPF